MQHASSAVSVGSGNYFVRIENPDGNCSYDGQTILLLLQPAPSFSTNAGSLGTILLEIFLATVFTIAGSSDSTITFSEVTSVLTNASQANCSLTLQLLLLRQLILEDSSTTAQHIHLQLE